MAIDFPNSPSVNDIYTAGGKTWQWNGTYWSAYGTGPVLRASDTPPLSPNTNDLWYETDTGSLFAYVDSVWVEVGASSPITAAAGDLTGATLASNVVSSSLTSVGTITNLQATAATINGWTVSQPGLVLIKTQTVGTGVSVIEVTDAFSSTYDNYRVTYSGGTGSTWITFNCQFGVGTTWTTNNYYGGSAYFNVGGGTWQLAVNNGGNSFAGGNAATDLCNLSLEIQNPYLARRTHAQGPYNRLDFGQVGNTWVEQASQTQFTSFKLATSSGTVTGGTIRVYGYRN